MTAGAGILHIEKPPEPLVVSGGLFHGLQLWVNLPPTRQDGRRRATRTSAAGDVALLSSPDGGALVRVIAGEVGGHTGPGVDLHADHDGARHGRSRAPRSTPWRPDFNALVYVLQRRGLRSAPSAARCAPASSRCSALATRSRVGADREPGQPHAGARRATSWAASRSASRSRSTGRS